MKNNRKIMSDMVPVVRTKKRVIIQEKEMVRKPVVREPEEMSDWEEPQSPPKKMGCALWLVVVVCLIMLTLVIGGFLATAQIDVYPKKITGAIDTAITFSQGTEGQVRFYTATKVFSDERIVPAQSVVSKDGYATGTIRFYNASSELKTIAAKTIVKSADPSGQWIVYKTKTAISIPKMTAKKPGYKDVEVTAESVGSNANIGLSDFVLANPVQGVTIKSVTEMKGGSATTEKIGDPTLIAQAHDELVSSFAPSADLVARMEQEIPNEMIVLPITFVDSTPVFTLETNHEDGVHVVAHKSVAITMVNRTDFAHFITGHINAQKSSEVTISSLDGLSITTSTLASPSNIPETMQARISGNAVVYGKVSESVIKTAILGKSRAETRSYLKDIPEVDHFDIHIMPFWRRILPLDAEKIVVKLINP